MAALTDELIRRIVDRAGDVARRTAAPLSGQSSGVFIGGGGPVDLATMFGLGRDETPLPSRATAHDIAAAEGRLGLRLPTDLARLYKEVSNGGFGPSSGLLSLTALVDARVVVMGEPPGPGGQAWPDNLLPLVALDPGCDCLDLQSGAVASWDPEGLADDDSDDAWKASFRFTATDLASWFESWLGAPSARDRIERGFQKAHLEALRARVRVLGAMTPAELEACGLDPADWKQTFFKMNGVHPDDL